MKYILNPTMPPGFPTNSLVAAEFVDPCCSLESNETPILNGKVREQIVMVAARSIAMLKYPPQILEMFAVRVVGADEDAIVAVLAPGIVM